LYLEESPQRHSSQRGSDIHIVEAQAYCLPMELASLLKVIFGLVLLVSQSLTMQQALQQYYNRHHSSAPSFSPSDMVYLDSKDIQTTRLSKKLSHCHLGPYPVERRVGKYAYHLILPPPMRCLHPVFDVVKLSLPELVDGEEEYIVEKILNSRMF